MLKKLKFFVVKPIDFIKKSSWKVRIALFLLFVALFTFVSIEVTGQPGFCNSCHVMNPFYDSWAESGHSEVNCLSCHLKPGFMNYVQGKINGLAQAVDCAVGRIGTKPNAPITDASCLREECHSQEKLAPKMVEFNGVKFEHTKHINNVVGGIHIACNTCHRHFEGDKHFEVTSDVCFTCHFLKNSNNGEKLVQTGCTDCHEVPQKIIERGFVKVNHAEFVSYDASCEDSCHSREIEKESNVSETVCLSCHTFVYDKTESAEHLHEVHSHGEKVECFSCHGKIVHGQTEVGSVSSMIECTNCHSDTHNIQLSTYTAEDHQEHEKTDMILSPMFLTHVRCNSCHIEPTKIDRKGIGSIGKVARPTPEACDKCHEKGTGDLYIPMWQKKIKTLHSNVKNKLEELDDYVQKLDDKNKAESITNNVKEARQIVISVELDGSWGVHNLKYTESILNRANKIIDENKME